jgi:hypothetical protein
MYAYFPIVWKYVGGSPEDGHGGPPVDDPGTIYIVRDQGIDDDWANDDLPEVAAKTSLTELVTEEIESSICMRCGVIHQKDAMPGRELIAALRAAAQLLEDAIETKASKTDECWAMNVIHKSAQNDG